MNIINKGFLDFRSKEDCLAHFRKMDAVSAQGVWLAQFPVGTRHAPKFGGLYWWMIEEYKRRRSEISTPQSARELRKSLMEQVVKRLEQEDLDDTFILLAT
jgi:hypothetical protein